jgi:hypothetical protein
MLLIVIIIDGVEATGAADQNQKKRRTKHYPLNSIMMNPIHLTLGSLLFAAVNHSATTHYVSLQSPNPQSPYASWSTAATTIQEAVNSAQTGDYIVVNDGVYAGSVAVSSPVTLVSVNGPRSTVINGGGPCISLASGATLIGFTVTGGFSNNESKTNNGGYGGGVYCASASAVVLNCVISNNIAAAAGGGVSGGTLYNCTLTGNRGDPDCFGGGAFNATLNNCTLTNNDVDEGGGAEECTLTYCTLIANGAPSDGGGAYLCSLTDCILSGNQSYLAGGAEDCALTDCLLLQNNAGSEGGGAWDCSLTNCTLTSNSAGSSGGGASDCTLNNCISYFNSVTSGTSANYDTSCALNYCCTTPLPASGIGNIANGPLFMNAASDNFQLQSSSPCINSGNNAYVTVANDLAGNPRIVGGTVDMGAYEYQTAQSEISYAYLQQYGLPTDGSVDLKDLDGSGFNVYQDWVTGLNPTNRASVLAMLSPATTNDSAGVTVKWKSVNGILYDLQRSTDLIENPVFSIIQGNIPGQIGATSYQDSSATNKIPYFYRVGVVAP